MGFLEDLRQKRKIEQIAYSEAIRKKTQAEKERAENEERRRQYHESVKYMNMSDFPRLTDKLASLVSGMEKSTGFYFATGTFYGGQTAVVYKDLGKKQRSS